MCVRRTFGLLFLQDNRRQTLVKRRVCSRRDKVQRTKLIFLRLQSTTTSYSLQRDSHVAHFLPHPSLPHPVSPPPTNLLKEKVFLTGKSETGRQKSTTFRGNDHRTVSKRTETRTPCKLERRLCATRHCEGLFTRKQVCFSEGLSLTFEPRTIGHLFRPIPTRPCPLRETLRCLDFLQCGAPVYTRKSRRVGSRVETEEKSIPSRFLCRRKPGPSYVGQR